MFVDVSPDAFVAVTVFAQVCQQFGGIMSYLEESPFGLQ